MEYLKLTAVRPCGRGPARMGSCSGERKERLCGFLLSMESDFLASWLMGSKPP